MTAPSVCPAALEAMLVSHADTRSNDCGPTCGSPIPPAAEEEIELSRLISAV
jgi:hypothetical protein